MYRILTNINRESKKNDISKGNQSMYVKRSELDKIVEEETRKRNPRVVL